MLALAPGLKLRFLKFEVSYPITFGPGSMWSLWDSIPATARRASDITMPGEEINFGTFFTNPAWFRAGSRLKKTGGCWSLESA